MILELSNSVISTGQSTPVSVGTTAVENDVNTKINAVEPLNTLKQEKANTATEKVLPFPTASSELVSETVDKINDVVQTLQRDLKFTVDDSSGTVVVTVLDTHSKEVIRQIPTEQVMALAENIENLKGILFSEEV